MSKDVGRRQGLELVTVSFVSVCLTTASGSQEDGLRRQLAREGGGREEQEDRPGAEEGRGEGLQRSQATFAR